MWEDRFRVRVSVGDRFRARVSMGGRFRIRVRMGIDLGSGSVLGLVLGLLWEIDLGLG